MGRKEKRHSLHHPKLLVETLAANVRKERNYLGIWMDFADFPVFIGIFKLVMLASSVWCGLEEKDSLLSFCLVLLLGIRS